MIKYNKLISKNLKNINIIKYTSQITNNIKHVSIVIKNSIKYITYYVKAFIYSLIKPNMLLKYLLVFLFFISTIYKNIAFELSKYKKELPTVINVDIKQVNKKIFLHVNLINIWKKWYYINIQLSKICNIIKKKLMNNHDYITLKPLYKINFFIER